jgi:NAD(P)-dependent dehydrogenase (short-subunit alcohol dehydrogenase family)
MFAPTALRTAEECRRAIAQTVRETGSLDVLVNVVSGAGTNARRGIRTLFFSTRAALPYFRAGSLILNLHLTPFPLSRHEADYVTRTVGAMTRSLALGLSRRGVHVSAITVAQQAPTSSLPFNQATSRSLRPRGDKRRNGGTNLRPQFTTFNGTLL